MAGKGPATASAADARPGCAANPEPLFIELDPA